MKILGKLIIFLLSLLVLLSLVAFLLPKEQHVERSIEVNASPAEILPYVTNFKNFNEWSPWASIDPEGTTYEYTGPESGIGAKMSWKSDNHNVGSGTQEIKAISGSRVDVFLDFGRQGTANAYYLMEDLGNNKTKFTWAFDTDLGNNPVARWMGLMMDKWVGTAYEDGLNNLNKLMTK